MWRNKLIFPVLMSILGAAATLVFAGEYRKLEGDYALKSASLIDPPLDEKIDRVVMNITGNAAREIYDAMPVKAIKSPCLSKAFMKSTGKLECTKDGRLYSCTVAVLLKSGNSASAFVC